MNPFLARLGYERDDRVIVIHADDVGMCGATVDAFFELADSGAVTSGSAMVPCPWFPEVASRCRRAPDIDVGVHLTLTSEWDGYRWAPLSTCDPTTGLIDTEGYFHRNQDRWRDLDGEAAAAEMAAQVSRAISVGIDVTHLDSHMFSILHASLASPYVELGISHRIPVLLTRQAQWVAAVSEESIAAWERRGMPVFDHVCGLQRLDGVRSMLDALPPGLTYLIAHPAKDTAELRAIAPDWLNRVADFETLVDPALPQELRRRGIKAVGWRQLRGAMAAATPTPPRR